MTVVNEDSLTELLAQFAEVVEYGRISASPKVLSILQMRILAAIYFADQPLSIHELANAVGIKVPSASVLLDKLVRDGMVYRKLNLHDRRIVLVTLAPLGKRTIGSNLKRLKVVLEAAVAGFSERDQEVIHKFFRQFMTAALNTSK